MNIILTRHLAWNHLPTPRLLKRKLSKCSFYLGNEMWHCWFSSTQLSLCRNSQHRWWHHHLFVARDCPCSKLSMSASQTYRRKGHRWVRWTTWKIFQFVLMISPSVCPFRFPLADQIRGDVNELWECTLQDLTVRLHEHCFLFSFIYPPQWPQKETSMTAM